MWWRRDSPMIALLKEEVEWLRAQLELARQNQDRLRHEVITLASAKAAAEILYYDPAKPLPASPPAPWPPPRARNVSASPFDNHLAGGEHIEFVAEDEPHKPGQPLNEEELVERTIETAALERERARMIPTVAD
jgi:hypothetical protein